MEKRSVKLRPTTLRLKGTYLPSGVGTQIVNANSVKNDFLGEPLYEYRGGRRVSEERA